MIMIIKNASAVKRRYNSALCIYD